MSSLSTITIQNSTIAVNVTSSTQMAAGIAGAVEENTSEFHNILNIVNSTVSGYVSGNTSSGYLVGVIGNSSNISIKNSKLCFSGSP